MAARSIRIGVVVAILAAAVLALLEGDAAATVSPTYTVSGAEYSATSTEGKFAGYAVGSTGDVGLWNADVRHQALSANCLASQSGCAVTPGGSMLLTTSGGNRVSGSFTGGSIGFVRQAPGCGKQIFHIVGHVATTVGAGTFDVALVHHRRSIVGVCVVYSATVGADAVDGIPGMLSF